jgi:AraC family transcriptional regulator
MLAFGTYVAGTYGGLRAPRMASGINAWQRRAATEMIEARLDGRITIEELAAVCGLSVSRFAHAFRSSFGVAPYQWLQARRIERAKTMLSGSDGALADIALASGFADQSHFGRVFRRVVRMSPGAFRRTLRGS